MRDVVPLKPVREAVEAAMALQEWSVEDERLMPLTRMWDADDFKKMFVRTDRETIPFDFADQTLCLLGLQFLWWDELADIYYSVNLEPQKSVRILPKGHKRCERVGCSNTFEICGKTPRGGPTGKRFCTPSCRIMSYRYRKGIRPYPSESSNKERITGEGGFVCRNGHERTPENTLYDKRGRRCRLCANATARRGHRRKKEALLAA